MLAVTMHEIGHALYLKYKKIPYERGLDDVGYYFKADFITQENKFNTAGCGIFLGMFPLLISMFFLKWWPILFILYYVGSYSDILVIWGFKK